MFAICIESSHKKGMGHLFRALNFVKYLGSKNESYIVLVNDHEITRNILVNRKIPFQIVDLIEYKNDWETKLIQKYKISVWINDRLDTEIRHTRNVKKNNIKLITFDDRGNGASLADINITALAFEKDNGLEGKRVLTGVEYLILDAEIDRYKRVRNSEGNIIITLGGSDTYGVTLKVVNILKSLRRKATIHTGPSFKHTIELEVAVNEDFSVINNVSSLVETFYNYDMAITGGGITPFEANASGLPCIIIANEPHEVQNGLYLEKVGSSVFAGYHEKIDERIFEKELDIKRMSMLGMEHFKLDAAKRIYTEIIR